LSKKLLRGRPRVSTLEARGREYIWRCIDLMQHRTFT
jgi:hypothetical protein